MYNFALTPTLIIFAATVLVVLVGLTMRAVIRRDKAMIDTHMEEPQRADAYVRQWRSAGRELASDSAEALAKVLPSNRSAA